MVTLTPEDWMRHVQHIFQPSPFERMLKESVARRWARLEAENPVGYRREQRRSRFRNWCLTHHIPLPFKAFRPRLPTDPRFETWQQPCIAEYITFPIKRDQA